MFRRFFCLLALFPLLSLIAKPWKSAGDAKRWKSTDDAQSEAPSVAVEKSSLPVVPFSSLQQDFFDPGCAAELDPLADLEWFDENQIDFQLLQEFDSFSQQTPAIFGPDDFL